MSLSPLAAPLCSADNVCMYSMYIIQSRTLRIGHSTNTMKQLYQCTAAELYSPSFSSFLLVWSRSCQGSEQASAVSSGQHLAQRHM